MFIYQIKLPKDQDVEAFVTFMREEYIPDVLKKGPTRVGRVTELALLESSAADHEFFLHVGWSGVPFSGHHHADKDEPPDVARPDDEQIVRKFKSFGGHVQSLGFYREVAASNREG